MNTWRKVGLALLGLGIVTFTKSTAVALPTDTISVVVQVQVVSVNVSTTAWNLTNEYGSPVTPGSVYVSSAILVTNDGNVQEDYRLSLDEEGDWAPSTGDATVDTNEFAMLGLFTNTAAASLNSGMFNDQGTADDVIDTTVRTATDDLYAINGDAAGVKGFDVAAGATRNLFLNFRTPSANTVAATQYITVTVTAIAG